MYLNESFPSFLIAMPSIGDDPFNQSVIMLAQDDEHGSFGVIVNKELDVSFESFFSQLNLPTPASLADKPLHYGGPVEESRGMVLHAHDTQWENSIHINEELSLTSSMDIFEAIAHEKGPDKFLVILGHSAWAPGQLEEEILLNFWLHSPIDAELIFEEDIYLRWAKTFERQGIDPHQLSTTAGHA